MTPNCVGGFADTVLCDGRKHVAEGLVTMDMTPPEITGRHASRRAFLDPTATILLAISFGLCGGFLDVGIIVFKKCCWNNEGHYRTARDFPWTVPLGHAALMVVPGVLLAAIKRIRPALISVRLESGLLATLAIWLALLRMPLYAACSLLMAAGAGRLISDAVAARGFSPPPGQMDVRDVARRAWCLCCPLVGLAGGP